MNFTNSGFHGTTILAVRRAGKVAMGGDGQVTFGDRTIVKHTANKIRRLHGGRVLAGFAGSLADALTLFEKFETALQSHGGQLVKAAVELAKEWRTNRMLQRLEAMLIVADRNQLLILSGGGEVIEPEDEIAAVGSGGNFAIAAARALVKHTDLPAGEIVREAMRIAADLCVYTNHQITVEEIE